MLTSRKCIGILGNGRIRASKSLILESESDPTSLLPCDAGDDDGHGERRFCSTPHNLLTLESTSISKFSPLLGASSLSIYLFYLHTIYFAMQRLDEAWNDEGEHWRSCITYQC